MTTSIAELAEILQKLLTEDASVLGRETGFIQRARKFNGASFAQALVVGWQASPHASLEDLCQSAQQAGVEISPQGLQERLNNPQASLFMQAVLTKGLSYLVESAGLSGDLLARFEGVYIQDSSIVSLPDALQSLWRGCGNQKSKKAALKIHTVFDYQRGGLTFQVVEAYHNDNPLQKHDLPQGSLRLADIGFFKIPFFKQFNREGVYWLSRLPARVGIWTGEKVEHLSTYLADFEGDCLDTDIELSAQRLSCRLIAIRVPDEVAQQRRKRAQSEAQSRPHQLQEQTLTLCAWTIIVTNLSRAVLSISEALILLRLRWQIELVFKLWKQEAALAEWRTRKPGQILTEVFSKLLIVLIQHWLLVLGLWHEPERSLFKAVKLLRKQAFHLFAALTDFSKLLAALETILAALSRCKIQKRKARPAAFQLLVSR
jgi:hypothetical protein